VKQELIECYNGLPELSLLLPVLSYAEEMQLKISFCYIVETVSFKLNQLLCGDIINILFVVDTFDKIFLLIFL
jgi:hypothetical protein